MEVLILAHLDYRPGKPRLFHSLLVGGGLGLALALLPLPWGRVRRALLRRLGLAGATGPLPVMAGGIGGAWFHVLIDGLCGANVAPFWPLPTWTPLNCWSRRKVKCACLLALVLHLVTRLRSRREPTE